MEEVYSLEEAVCFEGDYNWDWEEGVEVANYWCLNWGEEEVLPEEEGGAFPWEAEVVEGDCLREEKGVVEAKKVLAILIRIVH